VSESSKLRRAALAALALGGVLLAGWWVYVTFLESEEAKVRKALASAVAAAEDRNPGDLVATMTAGFRVTYRKYQADRAEVRQAMIRMFLTEYKHGFEVTVVPATTSAEQVAQMSWFLWRFQR